MSLQKGTVGVNWSVGVGASTIAPATGMGSFVPQSAEYQLGGDERKIRGADGATVNLTFFDREDRVTLEVIPADTTIALAKSANILPDRGADVTVTDSLEGTGVDEFTGGGAADGTGTYIFESGTKRETVDGEVRLTFVLVRGEKHLADVAAA